MRAGGMQAEDTRMHLADGTLVKTPSAPCHRDDPSPACAGVPAPPTLATSHDNPQPRLRGGPASRPEGGFSTSCSYAPASTGVSTQRCRNSPPLPRPSPPSPPIPAMTSFDAIETKTRVPTR